MRVLVQEFEVGRLFQERVDDLFVFDRFDAAGRVDQSAIGGECLGCLFEQSELQFGQSLWFVAFQSPSCLGPFSQHTGIGAGHVDEYCVEGSPRQVLARSSTSPSWSPPM